MLGVVLTKATCAIHWTRSIGSLRTFGRGIKFSQNCKALRHPGTEPVQQPCLIVKYGECHLERDIAVASDHVSKGDNKMYCSACGQRVKDGDHFCQNCGAPLQTPGSVSHESPVPRPRRA